MAWRPAKYEADVLPLNADPTWIRTSFTPFTEEISPPGILRLTSSAPGEVIYTLRTPDADQTNVGITIEVRIRVVTSSIRSKCVISFDGGVDYTEVSLYQDRITISNGVDAETTYTIDTTDDFHIYRLTILGTTAIVYVDGILRLTFTTGGGGVNEEIIFGIGTGGSTADHSWDYIHWDTTGAYPPQAEDTSGRDKMIRGTVVESPILKESSFSEVFNLR